MGLGHGVGDDCSYPPGLAWEIEHCLPVIPRPQWERYLRNGRFNGGMQAILDATAHCHHYDAVVVKGDDHITYLDEPIHGVFPPGWHKGPCFDEPAEPAEPDSPPVFRRPERDPAGWGAAELERPDFGGNSQIACLVGRTVDLLLPYPLRDMTVRFPDGGTRRVLAGDMGNHVLRIPGAGHVLNNSGLGHLYTDRRFFSELGLAIWDRWDRQRPARSTEFIESAWPIHIFVKTLWGRRAIGEWTAPFQRTHMGCPRNHYPPSARYIELGVAGLPVHYRWAQSGGPVPLPPTATDYDVYEEAVVGWNEDWRYLEILHGYDADGNRYSDMAPEGGGLYVHTGGPGGEPPGTYLRSAAAAPAAPSRGLAFGKARYRSSSRLGCSDCSPRVDGFFDFIKDAASKILKRVEKILPNELEELADKIAPIASVALPPPFGSAAKAYQVYRSAVTAGDYDLAAQVTDVLKREGLPDPLDIIEGRVSVVEATPTGAGAGGSTGELGGELARAAQSVGLAAGAITAGALVLKALPRAGRFQASFRRRR